jgi:hypothetical protein
MKKVQALNSNVSKGKLSKFKMSLVSALLILGLTASPVQAGHYRHVIAPLATVAALAYLFDHSLHRSTYKRRSHNGYDDHNYRPQNGRQKHSRRKHSHSSGGYSHNSKHH